MPSPIRRFPRDFRWINEPPEWALDEGALVFTTAPRTDFWQRTHYGFRRDDGHVFAAELGGDFSLTAYAEAEPIAKYDQVGLICRVGPDDWAKCSAEFENPELSRLGSVVTVRGFSDWATQDVPSSMRRVWYRLDRRGPDIRFSWSDDGLAWRQMRIARLESRGTPVMAGLYGCSPTGHGFRCRAGAVEVGPNEWDAPD